MIETFALHFGYVIIVLVVKVCTISSWYCLCSYQLMQTCWKLDPDERPTPVDIVASLTPLDGVFQEGSTAINGTIQEDSKTNGFKPDDKHLASELTRS